MQELTLQSARETARKQSAEYKNIQNLEHILRIIKHNLGRGFERVALEMIQEFVELKLKQGEKNGISSRSF